MSSVYCVALFVSVIPDNIYGVPSRCGQYYQYHCAVIVYSGSRFNALIYLIQQLAIQTGALDLHLPHFGLFFMVQINFLH